MMMRTRILRTHRVSEFSPSRRLMLSPAFQRASVKLGVTFAFIIGAALSVQPRTMEAQTRFLWPDSRFDIQKYRYVDVCVAVKKRVSDSIQSREKDYRDTLHYTQYSITTPLPAALVAATGQCLTQFPPEKIPVQTMTMAQTLYLIAGQDAQARALLERQIQLIPKDSTRLIAAALDTGMNAYLAAQPIRLDAALDLHTRYEQLGSAVPMIDRVRFVMLLCAKSRLANDSLNEAKGLARMVALGKSMTDAEWSSMPGDWITIGVLMSVRSVYRDRFRQVLAKSTQDFQGLEGKIFAELMSRDFPPSVAENSMGWMMTSTANRESPVISGDYWFPAKLEGVTYPRKGVVTLVVPVDGASDANFTYRTLQRAAELHRFKDKWPALEIIMIANTAGFFKDIEPPAPEKEAMFIDSLFRQFRKMPGQLAVTNTKFWRLPGYDRRRVNEPTANQEAGRGGNKNENAELIDKEGKIVTNISVGAEGVPWLELLISTLLERPVQAP